MKKMQAEDDADGWDPNYKEGIFYVNQLSCSDYNFNTCSTEDTREMVFIYDNKSLYLFDSRTKFRKFLVHFIHHPIFENFVILCIAMNTFNLAIYDYNDRDAHLELN